ncbi:13444_t:CDS:2 [Entrophospora sp. SA101]|nr:13444_t:CDS:2 [Entrophospora sp. SA101]
MKERLERLKQLRLRKDDAEQANRKDLYEEHQRKKTNPKELIHIQRLREEAEKLQERQEAIENGEDYERKKFWEYSAEAVEKWEKKQQKKLKRSNIAFTDYNQVAQKKYKRMINEFTPDITGYNEKKALAMASASQITTADGEVVVVDADSSFFRDANSLQYASLDTSPSREAVDKVVNDVKKQIEKRDKFSRQKPINEEEDITYINERNRRFNEKIARFYDKYTQEIRENFERGTASSPYDPYIPKEGAAGGPPSKTLEIQKKIDETVEVMRDNLKSVAERGVKLDTLQDKTGKEFMLESKEIL